MSQIITLSIIPLGLGYGWREEHKDWALQENIAAAFEAARQLHYKLQITCFPEEGASWQVDEGEYPDFAQFCAEFEKTHSVPNRELLWEELLNHYKAHIRGLEERAEEFYNYTDLSK